MIQQRATSLQWFVLAMRWTIEGGIVVGLLVWGIRAGETTAMKILLAILAPAIVFGFWGFVDFRFAGRAAEGIRLMQELTVTALVGLALIASGLPVFGWLMIAVSIVYHAMVYATGGRLLKERHA